MQPCTGTVSSSLPAPPRAALREGAALPILPDIVIGRALKRSRSQDQIASVPGMLK